MNKTRRKNNRIGIGKRLIKDSLILSCTASVSSRFIKVFEKGILSPFVTSVKKVDRFAREKISGSVFEKMEVRKNYTKPARNAVSSFIMNNSVFRKLSALVTKFMNTSLRSVGIFLLTFGIYAAAIFLLKIYGSLSVGAGNTDDLIVSAIGIVIGLLLTMFGDKSILYSLGTGVITGRLLSGVLGVNDTTLYKASPKKARTSIGISFLMGSILGVLTMYFTTFQVLYTLAAVVIIVAVLNIPEFGLMLTAVSFAVISAEKLSVLAWITLLSYLLKCVRLKRNLRFGTADAIVLAAFILMLLNCIISGSEATSGQKYILCFTALYFAVKNMVVSKTLLRQMFNALASGVFLGMVAYLLGEFDFIIPYSQFRLFSDFVSENSLNVDMLAVMASAVLPIALCSFSERYIKKKGFLFSLVALACAFAADSLVFYGMIMLAFFVYIAVGFKAPAGAFLGGVFTVSMALWLLSNFTFANSVLVFYDQGYDASFMLGNATGATFWEGIFKNGSVSALILIAAVPLILQRILASVIFAAEAENRILFGSICASSLILLLMSLGFNLFADVRVICVFWIILGLCGSGYRVYCIENIAGEVYNNAKA